MVFQIGSLGRRTTSTIWLAFGANTSGHWGKPQSSIAKSIEKLGLCGIRLIASSGLYTTPPVGYEPQPRYFNRVAAFQSGLALVTALGLLKRIEREAGRRLGRRWGPRQLDIDIIDWGGRRLGRGAPRRAYGQLVLPHPLIQERGFVLVPLLELAPHWRHPVSKLGAKALLARRPQLKRGIVRAAD